MFDVIRHESKVVAVTKEIERTISPDKVTDMYDKVRDEVESSILKRLVIRTNEFHGSCMIIKDSRDLQIYVMGQFSLNGHEYPFKVCFNKYDKEFLQNPDKVWSIIVERLSDKIAVSLLKMVDLPELKRSLT